jgi:hypothetical protein
MNARPLVTLQINLAPTDLPHARYTLPHQLRQWAGQVDETLLVVDLHQSRGRYSDGWAERLPKLRAFIEQICQRYPNTRSVDADYSEDAAAAVSSMFFGGRAVPEKDWNGAPFYSYFFGLYAARHNYVFHMDCDMMYGGGSSTWVAEAIQLLTERPDVFACNPLPGPPTADGRLKSQVLEPEPYASPAFRARHLSTRLFLFDRRRFLSRIKELELARPPRLRAWQALLEGNSPSELAELIMSRAMARHGLVRIDFLGNAPGMWSIHPPSHYRSVTLYERLPAIILRIETGDVPEAQRGDCELNDSMVTWPHAKQPRRKRIVRRLNLILKTNAARLSLLRGTAAPQPARLDPYTTASSE